MLEHLTVRHNLLCRVVSSSGHENQRFTVISCLNADAELGRYFLRIGDILIDALGQNPSRSDVRAVVDRLVELLRALSRQPTRAIQGLWAELFLIAHSRNPVALAGAWHQLPSDLFDFASNHQRIEVKAAAGRARRHHFRLEQLTPPSSLELVVASLLVDRSAAGTSVTGLVERIRGQLSASPVLALSVEQTAASTLGSDWRLAHLDRFDEDLAVASLRFMTPAQIPRVPDPQPPEVSDVRFVVDLSGAALDSPPHLVGPLFGALMAIHANP